MRLILCKKSQSVFVAVDLCRNTLHCMFSPEELLFHIYMLSELVYYEVPYLSINAVFFCEHVVDDV